MSDRKTLAIDFDGTLCEYATYSAGEIENEPNEKAVPVMNELAEEYRLVVMTTRLSPEFDGDIEKKKARIAEWLDKHDIPYDEITNHKIKAMAYIDDRAIRFTNWQDIRGYFIQ